MVKLSELNRKNDDLPLTENVRKEAIKHIKKRILSLLDSSKKLSNSDENLDESACLYTYALEEYGKFLLLSQQPENSPLVKYYQEFKNHDFKIDLATKNLPTECSKLGYSGFEEIDNQHKFEDGFERIDTMADLKSRMGILYTDFNDDVTEIKSTLPIDANKLKTAIDKLSIYAKAIPE